jgi:AcrR family transcriptional regulator
MDGNGELSGRQLRVIPYLLGAPSIEEGCKRARVSKGSVYQWLKDEAFKSELRRQREQLTAIALDTLKAGIAKATVTLVKHLDSGRENISIRAAESIIEFAQKALEHENLEKRIQALEERIKQQGENWR